jgi:hypothetical protein
MLCWSQPTLSIPLPRGNPKGGSYFFASSLWEHSALSSTSTVGTKAWGYKNMSKEHDNTRQERSRTLPRLETFAFFLAMMLAVTLDCAFAHWVWKHVGSVSVPTLDQLAPLREQMGFTLPEGWLLAALVVLICQVVALLSPNEWSHKDLRHKQRTFMRLWVWAMALLMAQGVAIYLGPVVP